jgi:geranylgeranyl diphosphate synthase, type III
MTQKHDIDEAILEPYKYLSSVPGKDVRSKLIDCFQQWLQIDAAKLEIIKELIAMLHNASLLIDDIEDGSKMRRGVPVAHAIYGIPSTINCANYVYFLAMELCAKVRSHPCLRPSPRMPIHHLINIFCNI